MLRSQWGRGWSWIGLWATWSSESPSSWQGWCTRWSSKVHPETNHPIILWFSVTKQAIVIQLGHHSVGDSHALSTFSNRNKVLSGQRLPIPLIFCLIPPYLHSSPALCQSKHSTGHWWRTGDWAMSQRHKWAQWRGSERCSAVRLGSCSSGDACRSERWRGETRISGIWSREEKVELESQLGQEKQTQ